MRIRTSVLVAVLSLGVPAALTPDAAFAQAAQPTAQELYDAGMELYKAGDLAQAQTTLREVDPLQLPRELRPTYYNTVFDIDQKLSANAQPAPVEDAQPADPAPGTAQPIEIDPQQPAQPSDADLLSQADALAQDNPAEAIAVYQQVEASETASAQQKATAQARIAGLERRVNGDVTAARRLIALAEADLAAGNIDAAQAKLNSVNNSGVELGWFDSESVNKKLALIAQVRETQAAEAAAKAEADRLAQQQPIEQPAQPMDDGALAAAQARAEQAEQARREAEARLAAVQRQLAEQQQQQVTRGAPVSDLMQQARAQTADNLVEQGDRALRNGQLSAAVQAYEQATLLDPDNADYQQKLDQARAQLNAQMRPLDLLDKNNQQLNVDREAAVAEYEQAMKSATDALANKDFQAANDATIQARTVMSTNRGVFDQSEYNERITRAAVLQNEIGQAQRRAEAMAVAQAEADQAAAEAEAAREAERRKVEEVQTRLRAARAYQLEQNYEQALSELEAALFLDPSNPVIQGFRDMLQDSAIAVEGHRLQRKRDLEIANLALMNIEASTPYTDILTYPGEWPELTAMRLRGLDDNTGESEANRAAQAALRKIVTLSNDNLSLDQVIAFIRDTTGANIAVNWPALELVGIDQDSLVTISLTRVPAAQLLRLVLDQVSADAIDDDKAGFTIDEGVIKISTLRDLKSVTETRVYDIRDLLVQVPNFNQAPGFDLNDALQNTNSGGSNGGGGGGGGGSGQGLFGDDNDNDQDEDLPSRDELVDQITELIQSTVGDPDEWLDEESTLTELNGNMIIKTTSDNHRAILGLLGRLRETRAVQISVEARFLAIDNNFLEEFQFDLDLSFNRSNQDVFQNEDPTIDLIDNITGQGPADGIPDTNRSDGRPDNGGSTLPITIGSAGNTLAGRPGSAVGSRFTDAAESAFSLGYSFVNDIGVDLLVNATQANENSLSLTAPRVTFFNGQRAYVLVATQTAFVSDLEPIPDSIGFDPTLSVATTGVVLDVEGTISSDRRYVTMTLRPSLANLISLASFDVGGGGFIDDDNDPATPPIRVGGGTVQVPEIQITQVRNTVSVPDRGTLIIGGQRLVGEVEVEVGVPVLSKIPYINRLFTQNSTVQDERTLLILVRPTIIIQSEQEDILFPGLNEDPEGFNVGAFGP